MMGIQSAGLPLNSLLSIKNYAERLRGKEIAPMLAGDDFTEDHLLLRKIGREVFRHNSPSRSDVIKMEMSENNSAVHHPRTQAEINETNQVLMEGHRNLLNTLASVLMQIDILRANPDFDFDAWVSGSTT